MKQTNLLYESVTLKSLKPEEYDDATIKCKVLPIEELNEYYDNLTVHHETHHSGIYKARTGKVGEKIRNQIFTSKNNKYYILQDDSEIIKPALAGGKNIVLKNANSPSEEETLISRDEFMTKFIPDRLPGTYRVLNEEEELAMLEENIIIRTRNKDIVCPAGSYLAKTKSGEITFVEKSVAESTYAFFKETIKQKNKKK